MLFVYSLIIKLVVVKSILEIDTAFIKEFFTIEVASNTLEDKQSSYSSFKTLYSFSKLYFFIFS